MRNALTFLILSCFLVPTLSTPVKSSEIKKVEKRQFKITPGGYVTVKGDEGFIRVNSWDKPEVKLIMIKRAWGRSKEEAQRNLKKLDIQITEFENRLEIQLLKPNQNRHISFWDLFDPDTWSGSYRSPTVDFELTVPRQINLNLSSDEGDVTVAAITGDVEIEVDEGDISINEIHFNELSLVTDEGDIEGFNLKNPDGRLSIEVDEGDVNLEDVNVRRLRIECDEGNITINKLASHSCNISIDEGDVELEISLLNNDRYDINSDEGNVSFYLPQTPDARFDLETLDGAIRSDFEVRIIKREDGYRCRTTLGDGKALIKTYTDEGIIYLRQR